MFSFFKKNEISIRSVSIPNIGWPKVREEEGIIVWGNPERTAIVSVNYFELVPIFQRSGM